jgi:hypothetical protein
MTFEKVHFYIAGYKVSDGSQYRHIATFDNATARTNFVNGLAAPQDGDWSKLADESKFKAADQEAKAKGAFVFKLTYEK